MDYKSILKDLKAKKYAPVYFLQSEEPYYIDTIVNYIENEVLSEGERSFNQVVLYGKESTTRQIIDQAMQYPMMASHRVIIVKEAQTLGKFEDLKDYIANPSEQSILVLAYKHKKLDKRKKAIWTALKKSAVILETKKIYDNQVPALITSLAQEKGLNINPQVAQLIAEHLGTDLSKINNELEKLNVNLAEGSSVSLEDVQTYIGINKDYNVFELQKAIGLRDKKKSYNIIQYFSSNSKSNPIQMNIGALYSYFSKVFLAKKFANADNRTLAAKMSMNPYIVGEYKTAAKNYSLGQIRNALTLIYDMDKKCKGLKGRKYTDLDIYQEFLFNLYNH